MRPIRAFLFAVGANAEWQCRVFRDFETLLEAAIVANSERQYPVGIHVGFERPDTRAVEDLLSKQDCLVFLSNGAMGTMPFPVSVSLTSIGVAGESSFHAALDGFGYQIEQPAEAQPPPGKLMSPMPSPANNGPKGWVANLSHLDSGLVQTLRASKIWDEDSYLLNEARLDLETRYVSGLLRYEILEGEKPNANSLLNRLRSAPPWLLSAPIIQLNLTVRASNVCAANGIKAIEDFVKYGLNGLYKLPNLGQKSVREISQEIVRLFMTGSPLRIVASRRELEVPADLKVIPSGLKEGIEDSGSGDEKPTQLSTAISANITSGFIEVAQKLTVIERGIWAGRLGFRCEPMTLKELADQIGVTRERVRQMEAKLYKKVHNHLFWHELSRRVKEHIQGRTSPLFLDGLPAIDPWFEGVGQLVNPLREVSEHINHLRFNVLNWNDLPVISSLSQKQWLQANNEAKSLIMAMAGQNLSESDALSQVGSVLAGKGEDMREALLDEVSKFCIWSVRSDGSRILAGFGNSPTALVAAVLQASDSPLHIEEILRRVGAYSAHETTSARNIQKAASEVGLLYGRGAYGLMKHCPLNPSQMLALRAEVEDIIFGGSSSKQWHSSELYDELLNRGFDYEGRLTKYIINIALSKSTDLVYLRRMIWGVRGKWRETADARLDVKQAIVSLLEKEGKPMSTTQIRSRLIEERGLNNYFQIWASSPLIRLGPGLWGLEGRDLDMQHARTLTYQLLKELVVRQEGMHVSEVAAFLGLSSEGEVSKLTSVGNTDGLRIDKGQYCYLQPWGESRRISISEAATSTLKAHPKGLSRGDLKLFVERISKRKVYGQQLSSVLQNLDATYDAESSLWKFTGSSENESESDEDSPNSSCEI